MDIINLVGLILTVIDLLITVANLVQIHRRNALVRSVDSETVRVGDGRFPHQMQVEAFLYFLSTYSSGSNKKENEGENPSTSDDCARDFERIEKLLGDAVLTKTEKMTGWEQGE
ncbi:hypothetical protein P152DRAFT_282957 [Eremomyces bilateralis CBS 781.70]|uniref:Uncharacterized protein n=1 Tax=Eremomyces bilateralis CBS 781.70 TaxID=1392243 RepID=A0A6G1G9U5_9PEZI|nr:uncharacterized protein P152DRAFT_282957 [Eremomyces bilateralis CBS 781.70]KAF1814671.1 hypothetical protein P152DRAFT_282957 [Eremomyces bilateralis CBS 781.70]